MRSATSIEFNRVLNSFVPINFISYAIVSLHMLLVVSVFILSDGHESFAHKLSRANVITIEIISRVVENNKF